ncbi:MAG: hypothetical protein Q4G62_03085 [Pseudomonadota bacterium]|nr:hypothetical protein [Pseudomonadota bacterium]
MHTNSRMTALLIAAACLTSAAHAQDKVEKRLYCWNEGGRKVCGDALPVSAVNSARTELSPRTGLPRAEIGRALSAEELAAQREQAQLDQLAADASAAQARADIALADSYDSEQALKRAYQIRYELVDESLKTSQMAITNQRHGLLRLLQAAADLEMKGQTIDKQLAENIQKQRSAFLDVQSIYRQQQLDRKNLDTQLAESLSRWRQARGLDAPPADSVASTNAEPGQ